jgi:hypothetical protein
MWNGLVPQFWLLRAALCWGFARVRIRMRDPQVHVDFYAQCFALFACCKFMACSGLAYAQSGQHFHSFMATLFG